jgi:CRISPR/Cas system-associated exonuclease Cas4 (RecB family)
MMETEIFSVPEPSIIHELNEVANEIMSRLDAARQDKRAPYDRSDRNYVHEIGHPCLKYLVHARLDWDKKKQPDIDAEYRFEEGNRTEWDIKKDLGDIGFELLESQRYFSIDELKIRGKIDGILGLPRSVAGYKSAPAEIKSINPNYWQTTKTAEEIRSHRCWWIRGYVSQLNTYLFAMDIPFGFFIFKTFGKRPRVIPFLRDEELWVHDSSRLRKVNEYVEAREYPAPIPYDPSICGMCDFAHLCQPIKTTEFTQIDPAEEELLKEFLELKKWAERYEEMKKSLIGNKEKPGRYFGINAIVGGIAITTKIQQRTVYDVPAEIKAPYAKKQEVIITSIERIE